jgi:gliding motility-associated-like protein
MSTLEGCATISDRSGSLLFYTDGITIWNRNHQVMTNGTQLFGNPSSSHSGVIVPKPGSNIIYYVFTVAEVAGLHGICYSIVNMSLSGGLGAVTKKNTQLITPALEKLTAVRHATQSAFWIIVHAYPGNAFYSYLITSSGISSTPVTSNVGTNIGSDIYSCRGCIKVSPNGEKIALAHSNIGIVQLLDFNNRTGIVSNPVTFKGYSVHNQPYGVEFSPSSTFLYIGEWYAGSYISQYNLNAPDIEASKTIIGYDSNTNIGALQLAPDGKIYVAVEDRPYLGIIRKPDTQDTGCSFILTGQSLGGKSSKLGLPTFIQSYFESVYFVFDNVCKGDVTQFNSLVKDFDSLCWDFGDTASGNLNHADIAEPEHKYLEIGTYYVNLTVYINGKKLTYAQTVEIIKPEIDLGKDTFICRNETLLLNASIPNAMYKWQDGSSNSTYTVSEPGTYSVEINMDGCMFSDSINITSVICEGYLELPNVFTPNNDGNNDTFKPTICEGIKSMSTYIYDRYGNLVFQSDKLNIEWNGLLNDGSFAAQGNYYWIIEFTDVKNKSQTFVGTVSIFK